jgi:tRNA-dihydrouridine synthase
MKDFELMLAPLEDYSHAQMREECHALGADSTFTEMARTAALARGNKSTVAKTLIPNPIPTYIQIIGTSEKDLEKYLEKFTPQEGFLGFNFNLGCPSKNMIKRGLGCALIKRVNKVKTMVQVVRDHGYGVSIKMRLGLNQYEKERKVYLNLIKEVDADFFIIHARHGNERDRNPADFSIYKECVATGKVIIANGDITTKEQVKQLKAIGIRGAMIGRGAMEDPAIFSKLKSED